MNGGSCGIDDERCAKRSDGTKSEFGPIQAEMGRIRAVARQRLFRGLDFCPKNHRTGSQEVSKRQFFFILILEHLFSFEMVNSKIHVCYLISSSNSILKIMKGIPLITFSV